jgi:hypothetical protein
MRREGRNLAAIVVLKDLHTGRHRATIEEE